MNGYSLGIDVGTSFVKVCLLDLATGKCVSLKTAPLQEQEVLCEKKDWAEQHPDTWWANVLDALCHIQREHDIGTVKCIGISYQMHGLVCVDKDGTPLRNAILWCDGRAVPTGERIIEELGKEGTLQALRNAPANFTFSRLRWVQENEPDVFNKIHKVLLPGEYIAYKLSGSYASSFGGASEQILWDFSKGKFASWVPMHYNIPESIFPPRRPCAAIHSYTTHQATALGLSENIPISFLGGDQTVNAISLGAFAAQTTSTQSNTTQSTVKTLNSATMTPDVVHATNSVSAAPEPTPLVAAAGTSAVLYGLAPTAGPYRDGVNWFVHANATFGYSHDAKAETSVPTVTTAIATNIGVEEKSVLQDNASPATDVDVTSRCDAGALLCVNGAGSTFASTITSLYSDASAGKSKQEIYSSVNALCTQYFNESRTRKGMSVVDVTVLPFGNGPERMLSNRSTGHCVALSRSTYRETAVTVDNDSKSECDGQCLASLLEDREIDSLVSEKTPSETMTRLLPFPAVAARPLCSVCRTRLVLATMEAIAFALYYGAEIMRSAGVSWTCLRAGRGGMFKSRIFVTILATLCGVPVQVVDTDVAVGAARGAAVGTGLWADWSEAGKGIEVVEEVFPEDRVRADLLSRYSVWCDVLANKLKYDGENPSI